MSERERRDMFAAAALAATVPLNTSTTTTRVGDQDHNEHRTNAEGVAKAAYAIADAMLAARGPDSPAPAVPSGCYAIPKEVCDAFEAWFIPDSWCEGAVTKMVAAIAAARGARA